MRKAIAYIDGYNLYYSRLRGTSFKWLDLFALIDQQILRSQAPDVELVQLKYFTAPAKAKFATHGKQSEISQNEYHRALRAKHGSKIDIVSGYHTTERVTMLVYEDPPDKSKRIPVWRIEEKQTDVNIALAMYRDALRADADLIVLCSNDSDLVPAVKLLRQDCPQVEIGIVAPVPPSGETTYRWANADLREAAHWTRHYIRDDELAAAQLPDVVPTKKKAARRPAYW